MSRLIHLNGPPGVGKSTLARRYAADHPGVLVLEIDRLRTMVAGWEQDPVDAGHRIRGAALAAMTSYLRQGDDVVVPQLLANPGYVAGFAAAAAEAGATYVHVVLTATPEEIVRRFRSRGEEHPWARHVTEIVEAEGGDAALHEWVRRLESVDAIRLETGDPESTYADLLGLLG